MADEPTTAGGETPPADPPAPAPDPAPPAPPSDDEPFDKDRAMALIAKLRDEAKEAKAQAKDVKSLREQLEAIEREKLTEAERIAKEREEAIEKATRLEQTNRENAVKLAVFQVQQDKGIADAELALAALDRSKIEFGDDGAPTNIGELLDDLLERKPLLRAQPPKPTIPSTDGGAGGTTPPDLTADELEAAAATGMSPERYAAIKARLGGRSTVSIADLSEALAKKG